MTVETPYELLAKGPGYFFALWREVYVLDFRGTVTVRALDDAATATARVRRCNPVGFVALNLLDATAALPDRAVRERAAAQHDDQQAGCLLHATVVHGTGFGAAALRSALAGLSIVSRHRMVRRVFGTTDPALDWFAAERRVSPAWRAEASGALAAIRAAT